MVRPLLSAPFARRCLVGGARSRTIHSAQSHYARARLLPAPRVAAPNALRFAGLRCASTLPTKDDGDERRRDAASASESIVFYALAGNLVIMTAKGAVALTSGSTAMSAEAVHSAVDAGNQALLLVGLRTAARAPSAAHPYGYGKSVYLWSLVSALGTFWLGAGVALHASVSELMMDVPSVDLAALDSWDVWTVLGLSFVIDGAVLYKTASRLLSTKPENRTFLQHLKAAKDPTLLAVLCEDAAACAGVLMAAAGAKIAVNTGCHGFDAASGVGVGLLLGGVGAVLASINGRYLIGSAVERDKIDDIERIMRRRPAIDDVHSVQTQWVGPDAFAYKCEVDFDGTWVAAQLFDRYEPRFAEARTPSDLREALPTLLSFYAEDVMRAVEAEVRAVENAIRADHPDALFIEIEPDARATTAATKWAVDAWADDDSRELETEVLEGYLLDRRRANNPPKRRRADASTVFELDAAGRVVRKPIPEYDT